MAKKVTDEVQKAHFPNDKIATTVSGAAVLTSHWQILTLVSVC